MKSLGVTCGQCGKQMTPDNSTAAPELFLCDVCAATHGIKPPTRPASPALDRLKEEIEGAPHDPKCNVLSVIPALAQLGCRCFKSRALRIIEEELGNE